MTMKKAKDKLIESIVSNYDILDDFVVWGLEEGLSIVTDEVERLLEKPNLKQHQFDDLIELYHDGKAMIRVLYYYTGDSYNEQKVLLNKAWDRMMGEFCR